MDTSRMKNLTHRFHMPHPHINTMTVKHLFHDARFWAVVAIVAVMTGLIILSIWASRRGGLTVEWYPPYMPYGY